MEEAYDLLDAQPTGFPKWELARNADGKLLDTKHLFIFEADEFFGLARTIPACRFVAGAEWIERASPVERTYASDGDPLCLDCMEVSLQHGLARMC